MRKTINDIMLEEIKTLNSKFDEYNKLSSQANALLSERVTRTETDVANMTKQVESLLESNKALSGEIKEMVKEMRVDSEEKDTKTDSRLAILETFKTNQETTNANKDKSFNRTIGVASIIGVSVIAAAYTLYRLSVKEIAVEAIQESSVATEVITIKADLEAVKEDNTIINQNMLDIRRFIKEVQ